jgi:hypothetical protein
MGTKELLLVASGIALGYLIFKKDLFKRVEKATKDVVSGATQGATELVNPKQAECEKAWQEKASLIRFSSQEQMLQAQKEFMTSCLL